MDRHPGASGAWSVRRVARLYNGPCLRLRRVSDNAEADFGFADDGWADTVAATQWLAGSLGAVAIWYDQSGQGRHMVQATAARQPQWDASVSEFVNRPAIRFTVANQSFLSRVQDVLPESSDPSTMFAVALRDTVEGLRPVLSIGSNLTGRRPGIESANTGTRGSATIGTTGTQSVFSASGTWPLGTAKALAGRFDASSVRLLFDRTVSTTSVTGYLVGNAMAAIGRHANGTSYFGGAILECLVYPGAEVDWMAVHDDQRRLRN